MYLVLALLKVALVNFTLNEYMMMMMTTVYCLVASWQRQQGVIASPLNFIPWENFYFCQKMCIQKYKTPGQIKCDHP